jgi:hypothetical protein
MTRAAFTCAIASLVSAAFAGERHLMTTSELLATLPGMTMTGHYADGVKFTESYLGSGKIDYRDDLSVDTGNWFERNGLFCTFYVKGQGACFKVVRTGENCFEMYVAESQDGTKEENQNWNSVGWDIKKPSTCDLSEKIV